MPTTNPVPSTDPTDLLFNAGKLDEVVNGTANSFTDRLGVARRTVAGMNADFDAQLADAESDLNVYRADAAASAAEALGYLQTIRATSYGAYAEDPTTDPLGNPPTVGDEYFNTTSNLLKRWNGTTWQASDINTANLAASSGSSLVGYDGGTVQDVLDGAKSLQDYAALRAYTGRATRIYITGLLVTAKPAGIHGIFQYDQTDTTSLEDGGTIIVLNDGRRFKRDYSGAVELGWFEPSYSGGDSTQAILKAHALGLPVLYPEGDFNCNAQLDLVEGGIIGATVGTTGTAKRTLIKFGGGISTRGAICTKMATQKGRPIIKDVYIVGASWDVTTGVRCNGLDIEAPAYIENVVVEKFYGNGAFFHNDAFGNGPYESFVRNLKCIYNRQHGCVVGTGANVLNFIAYEGKWNGSPSFGLAPSAPGIYDGFFVSPTGDGNPDGAYYNYTPESLTIIGGDCSYNSRYGWNISSLVNSVSVFPGYAEGNLAGGGKHVRVGNIANCHIRFATVQNNENGLQNDFTYSPDHPSVQLWVGGKQIFFGNNNYNNLAEAGVSYRQYLTNNNGDINWISHNNTPDGTSLASSGFGSVVTYSGFGNYAIGLGGGSDFIKISNNKVRLPQTAWKATSTGWNSAEVVRGLTSAMPTSGTYRIGDYYENSNPQILGPSGSRYIIMGWMRITAGSNNVLNTDWFECRALTGT